MCDYTHLFEEYDLCLFTYPPIFLKRIAYFGPLRLSGDGYICDPQSEISPHYQEGKIRPL